MLRTMRPSIIQISPENVLKFQLTQPAADRYTFGAADRYVQFGLDRRMQVVGHNLVWHSQASACRRQPKPAFTAVVEALKHAQ
jgi:endo-1,4-beta-xylanase